MRTRRTAFAAVFIWSVLVSASFAQDGIDRLLSERGMTLVSRDTVAGRTVFSFAAAEGVKFGVETSGDISEEVVRSSLRLLDTLAAWKSLSPGTQNFRVEGETVTLRLVPGKFVSGGKDLKPFVPSGLSFSASGERIEYDFRIKSGAYFLRFSGRLQNESTFLDRFKRAVDQPAAFARDNDPDYLSRRIVELQEALEAAEAKNVVAETRAGALETRLAAEESRLSALETRVIDGEKADVNARRATIEAHSKGFFAPYTISNALVDRVRALKTANPAIAVADIMTALGKEGFSASQRQVKAILIVYFGE